ncbi:MAG: hypothetical protein ABIA74_01215 [bacterium]
MLFEGYKQDQKQKFSKQQIKRSKHLTTPAYLDILTQTLNNPLIKIIPSDPRKNINEAFINCVKTFELLSNDPYEMVLEGAAKIKILNAQEKTQLNHLQKSCPRFKQIFKDSKKLKKTLTEAEKELRFCSAGCHPELVSGSIAEIISDILLNHYTILEKPYKDKLKIIMNNLITIYEQSFQLFDNKLYSKSIKSKDNKILIFAGQEHIENLKNLLVNNGYKIKKEIYDKNTINILKQLDNQIENGSLKNLEIQLEAKAQDLKLPNEAFDLII